MYRITTMYPEDPRAPFYDPSASASGSGSDAGMQPLARLHITREAVTKKACRDDDDAFDQEVKEAIFEDTETADDGERRE